MTSVSRKLVAEGLATYVQLPRPFKVHKGGNISHLKATEAGVALWRERNANPE